jgi:hypothetical protein
MVRKGKDGKMKGKNGKEGKEGGGKKRKNRKERRKGKEGKACRGVVGFRYQYRMASWRRGRRGQGRRTPKNRRRKAVGDAVVRHRLQYSARRDISEGIFQYKIFGQ